MSIYIEGWSMKDWENLLRQARIGANNAMIGELTIVKELPPHGRLIDADALIAWFEEWYDPNADLEICHIIDILDDNSVTPTIIPAEEGE